MPGHALRRVGEAPMWGFRQRQHGVVLTDPEPLLGRSHELAMLRTTLDDAVTGRGNFVVLAGDAGIGKSRLAAEVRELARRRGSEVFTGRAVAGLGTVAFRPLAEVLLTATRVKRDS